MKINHYAFANIGKYPPGRRRQRKKFQPELVDQRYFLLDPIRPYPEWPLICKQENLPAFETETALKKWLEAANSEARLKKTWRCSFCKHVHGLVYPAEVSGSTNGKNLRKESWEKGIKC